MAENKYILKLTLDYGVDYKTTAGIDGDVREVLGAAGINVFAVSRQGYEDGVVTVFADVHAPGTLGYEEAKDKAQAALNGFSLAFKKLEKEAAKRNPFIRPDATSLTESAPEQEQEPELTEHNEIEPEPKDDNGEPENTN